MSMKPKRKAFLYSRISPRPESKVTDYSLDSQLAKCRATADYHGWEVVGEYEDKCESGKRSDRPEFQNCIEAACNHRGVIVVYSMDRLARSLRDLLNTMERLRQSGAGVCFVKENLDTTSPYGRFMFHIFGAVAQFQGEIISEKTSEALQTAQANGKAVSDRVPLGYEMYRDENGVRMLKENPQEQAAIRRMIELRRQGYGVRRICNALRKEGYPPRSNPSGWYTTLVTSALKRAGEY